MCCAVLCDLCKFDLPPASQSLPSQGDLYVVAEECPFDVTRQPDSSHEASSQTASSLHSQQARLRTARKLLSGKYSPRPRVLPSARKLAPPGPSLNDVPFEAKLNRFLIADSN